MNKELRGGGNDAPLKYFSIGIAFVLAVLLVLQILFSLPLSNTTTNTINGGNLVLKPTIENGVTLDVATVSEENGVSKVLTATVKPDTAVNKLVDWTIEWNEVTENVDSPVTDFVTLTTESDGSNVATLTCLKAFGSDTIKVTVITREGGHTATCLVKYVGHPTELKIDVSSAETEYDDHLGINLTNIETSKTYLFPLSLDNVFNSVNADIIPEYTYDVTLLGSVEIVHETNESGEVVRETVDDADIDDDFTLMAMGGTTYTTFFKNTMLSVDIIDGALSIKANSMIYGAEIKNYLNSDRTAYDKYIITGPTDDYFRPYARVRVFESVTGFTTSIYLWPYDNAQTVEISNEVVEF